MLGAGVSLSRVCRHIAALPLYFMRFHIKHEDIQFQNVVKMSI
ncbi:hypothetical protein XfasM23_2135 [Xylella fastidiosa M23]|uniref:Uncharacterized protein n=1 Tax=Xylella fastidiosa (strain M23) TaxID=405441 RepID=B2IA95_XYLF2|nr:hypothetical protein XfasM23_2135 [Xylella fastidiosa M23]